MSAAASGAIRPAYDQWPAYNVAIRSVLERLSDEQLLFSPSPNRWPVWAIAGHLACQRVFWLCDFAGEPGAELTPFQDAAINCPGDDDLENVLTAQQLADALDSTFRIVSHCLDTWTLESLREQVRRSWGAETRVHTRGWVIQRVFAHDLSHAAELNEVLGATGGPQIDLWNA